MQQTEGQAK
jgi:hypothetical protein